MPMIAEQKASPPVGEVGGGPGASAAEKLFAEPPPNPPHKGEGLKRLNLPAGATPRARALRHNMTDAERRLWRALRIALPDHHWRKQVPLGPYIVDFCTHGSRLIIEVDGGQHAKAATRDFTRTRFLEGEGYRVIRFWNNDVLGNCEGVISRIAAALGEPVPPAIAAQ